MTDSPFYAPALHSCLEDPVPAKARWWNEAACEYVRRCQEIGKWGTVGAANAERCLRIWPDRFAAAGLPRPVHASDVTAEMVLRWKERPMGPGRAWEKPGPLLQTTAFQALWTLRGFLRASGSHVAELDGLWKAHRGEAIHRRWLDGAALDRLMRADLTDRQRLVIALAGWAGLRRREIVSLHVGDVVLAVDAPSMRVRRKGGRVQDLPISRGVVNALRPFVLGRKPGDKVYPCAYVSVDPDVRSAGRLIGLPALSCHDLRRTFGRVLYYERKVDINTIRVLYGHRSTEMTLYYIGASMDSLRSAVATLDSAPAFQGPFAQAEVL
jgi:integrase